MPARAAPDFPPTQIIGTRPALTAASVRLLTVSSVSLKYWRLSLCPMMTYSPQLLQHSCGNFSGIGPFSAKVYVLSAPSLMFVPAIAFPTASRHAAVGQTTTSHFASANHRDQLIYQRCSLGGRHIHFPVSCNDRFPHFSLL